jgi:peptide/nickel transport system substrate-binding protein
MVGRTAGWAGLGLLLVLATPAPVSAQGLRVGVPALPVSADPALAAEGGALLLARQVFDTLVRYREGSSDIEPALAASWSVSRDGLTWSFRLREGVRFSDGTPLTAQHVAASLERQLFAGQPNAPDGPAMAPRLLRGAPGVVQAVRVPDQRTLQLVLVQPYAPLLNALAHPALGVALVTAGSDGRAAFVGTGSFILSELGPGRAVLDASYFHWGGLPLLGRIVLLEYADPRRAEADLEARQLHVWLPAAAPATPAGALSIPGWRMGYLALNTEREPFSRLRFRQAVAAALGGGLLAPVVAPHAVTIGSFLPPGVWSRVERPPGATGPAEARRLLTESGLVRPAVSLAVAGVTPPLDGPGLAQAVRAALEAAGLSVTVRADAPEEALRLAQRGEHEMVLHESEAEAGDPHLLLYPLSASEAAVKGSARNLSFFRHPRLDEFLIRASQVSFRPERERVYARAQVLLADELPWVPLYARLLWAVVRPEVRGLRLHPSGAHRLGRVTLEAR